MKKLTTILLTVILAVGYFPTGALAQTSESYGTNLWMQTTEIGMNTGLDGDEQFGEDVTEDADYDDEENSESDNNADNEFEAEEETADNSEAENTAEGEDVIDEDEAIELPQFTFSLMDTEDGNYASDFTGLQGLIAAAPTDGTEIVIYITDDIEISGNTTINNKNIILSSDPDGGKTFSLYNGGASSFFSLIGSNGVSLITENIILDGKDETFSNFISTNGKSTVTLEKGTIIKDAQVSEAISNSGILNINEAEITNITNQWGVIYSEGGTININGSKFTDNARYTAQPGTFGSVMNCVKASLTINGAEFHNNYSNTSGGAIGYWPITNGLEFIVENSIFTENQTDGRGGAIYIYEGCSDFTIENCIFTDNIATQYGGAVAATSSGQNAVYNVTNTLFDNNTAETQYGGGLSISNTANNGKTNITNVTATNNRAGYSGGGIFIQGSYQDIEFTNINITNNQAGIFVGADNLYHCGGGLYANATDGTITFKGTNLIKDNLLSNLNPDATNRADGGGLMLCGASSGRALVTIEDSLTIEGNEITSVSAANSNYGGGAFFMHTDTTMDSVLIKNNRNNSSGGGMGAGNSTITIKNSEITGNYAGNTGGAIYLSVVFPILENTKIIHNTALGHGGGISLATNLTTSGVTLKDGCEVIYNRALNGDGGGIYMRNTANVPIQNLVFSDSDTIFYGNSAVASYKAPDNADTIYNNVGYTSTSIDVHPVNNFDINYTDSPDPNGMVTFIYDPNSGIGESYTTNWNVDEPYPLLDNEFLGYEKSGYIFTGWSTTADAQEAEFQAGELIDGFSDGDINTLYAQWQEIKYTATINYHPNGGSGSIYTPTVDIANAHRVLDNDITGFINDDHDFIGWSLAAGIQEVDYMPDDIIDGLSSGQTVHLYAQWQEIKTTIPPDGNENEDKGGGSGGGEGTYIKDKGPELEPLVFPVFAPDHYAYIVGYDNGTVRPEGQITRAEVATIFFRLLDDEYRDTVYSKNNSYSDVNSGDWFNNAVSTMSNAGVLKGYPDGSFKPNNYITRGEFATVIAQFTGGEFNGENLFSDITGHWAARYINIASHIGWIQGYPDGTYLPNNFITRAETVSLINRILERNPESPEDLLGDMVLWPDNMDTTKWYYLDIQEATNSHEFDRKENGHETWTGLRENRNWLLLER